MSEVCLALTTVDTGETAMEIARHLVEQRLAACVSVSGMIDSVYRWEGEVMADSERLLLIKCVSTDLEALEAELRAIHPYEVPEFLVINAEKVGAAYLQWLLTSTNKEPKEERL